ncbi:MAG: helix-turn-helix transcriptional regulator [Bacillota bacterium]
MEQMKKKRLDMGLTQAEAAVMCGISRYYYIDLELERRKPSVATAKKIATVLDFDWQLFYEDEAQGG